MRLTFLPQVLLLDVNITSKSSSPEYLGLASPLDGSLIDAMMVMADLFVHGLYGL